MLKQRVITAAVLLLIFAAVLFVLPPVAWWLFLTLVAGIGGWEWARLAKLDAPVQRIAYAVAVAVLVALLLWLPGSLMIARVAALAGLCFWVFATQRIVTAPTLTLAANKADTVLLLTGAGVLVITTVCLDALRFHAPAHSVSLLLYVMALVWVMDIGAYFSGKRFGKHKLAPLVSPGKTREGVVGGVVAAALLVAIALSVSARFREDILLFLVASVVAALVSVVGDLYESRLKRASDIKDSSQILPGHGGVLDRIDGVVAAIPVFLAFWIWA